MARKKNPKLSRLFVYLALAATSLSIWTGLNHVYASGHRDGYNAGYRECVQELIRGIELTPSRGEIEQLQRRDSRKRASLQ